MSRTQWGTFPLQAALALQRLGSRILHIGPTISVQGAQSLWESTFNVSFEPQKKAVLAEIEGDEVIYQKARVDMRVPTELRLRGFGGCEISTARQQPGKR